MKALLLTAVFLISVTSVRADPAAESIDTQIARKLQLQHLPSIRKESSGQFERKRVKYSGIAVRLFKTDNPLQLFNPAAPARYYSGPDNIARDPVTRKANGIKLFSISF